MTTRHSATATSISWIPSEAVRGLTRLPFDRGMARYDEPPPDHLDGEGHLEQLRQDDRFRFANVLRSWVDVDTSGTIVGHGQEGGGRIGATTLAVAGRSATFEAVPYPEIVPEPERGPDFVRFRQTAGGRTGVPTPRRVNRPPFVQIAAPTAWTTLELTIYADGRHDLRLAGASPFPRHWLYDDDGSLAAKSAIIEYKDWYRNAFGGRTPWGDADNPVAVGSLESDLERAISGQVMAASRQVRTVRAGRDIIRQGDLGQDVFLLLDGIVSVAVDGEVVAELGPGAVLGERGAAIDERRTATVTAVTKCRLAVSTVDALGDDEVQALAAEHRREEQATR